MKFFILSTCLTSFASFACADIIVPTRTIAANTVILGDTLTVKEGTIPGAIEHSDQIIGMEARIALFSGRPIRISDIRMPAVVERNQIIPIVYQNNSLSISAEGRALERASPGDIIRVMNLSSRSTVSARIGIDGAAYTSY